MKVRVFVTRKWPFLLLSLHNVYERKVYLNANGAKKKCFFSSGSYLEGMTLINVPGPKSRGNYFFDTLKYLNQSQLSIPIEQGVKGVTC